MTKNSAFRLTLMLATSIGLAVLPEPVRAEETERSRVTASAGSDADADAGVGSGANADAHARDADLSARRHRETQGVPSAAELAPDSFAPPFRDDDTHIGSHEQAESDASAHAGAEGQVEDSHAQVVELRLRDVHIEGARAELADATAAFRARLLGQPLRGDDIVKAAAALEDAYAQAGFFLVRVVVPEQQLDERATLEVVIVDGYLISLNDAALPEAIRKRVVALLTPLLGRPGLRYPEIERQLLLAGDMSGVTLRSSLAAGDAPASSVLTVSAVYRPISGSVSFDTNVSEVMGGWSGGLGLNTHSLLGAGETIFLRARGYPGWKGTNGNGVFDVAPRNRSLAGGLVLPVGIHGLTLTLEAAMMHTAPVSTLPYVWADKFDRYTARLRYPLLRTQASNINVDAAFDAQHDYLSVRNGANTIGISEDRLRIVRIGVDASHRLAKTGGVLQGRVQLSKGLDILGARSQKDASWQLPLSKMASDADFQKLEWSLGYSQYVMDHLGIDWQARGQTSFNRPMAASEGMGLSGAGGVSSFGASAIQGDKGWVTRMEVFSPWRLPTVAGMASLTPYAFGGIGTVWLTQPTRVERGSITAKSYGVGLRVVMAPKKFTRGVSLTMEYGKQLRNDDRPVRHQFHLNGSVHF